VEGVTQGQGLRRGIVRGYIAHVNVWGKLCGSRFYGGLRRRGSLSGRLCAGVGYSVGLTRGHLSGLFNGGGRLSWGFTQWSPDWLCPGHLDISHYAKF